MMEWSRFISFHLILLLMVATAKCKQCDILNSAEAVINSVVTLKCPLTPWDEVIWEVLQGDREERVGSVNNCSSSCTTETNSNRAQQTLCRLRTGEDLHKGYTTLTISPVEITDAAWYRCSVKNITGIYCSQAKIEVKEELQLMTPIEECKKVDPIGAVLNQEFKVQCPVDRLHLGASQLTWGTVEGDVTVPITRCPTLCTTSGTQKPLCEKAKTSNNGSLTISPVWFTDSQWFWCEIKGISNSCYTFKLIVKEYASTNQTIKDGHDSHTTQSPQDQTVSNLTVRSTTNSITITILTFSVILFVAMLVGGYCFRKQKKKRTLKVEPENPYEDIDETINTDLAQYSLAQLEPESLYTFKDK